MASHDISLLLSAVCRPMMAVNVEAADSLTVLMYLLVSMLLINDFPL